MWIANRTDEEIFYLWSMITLTVGLVLGCFLGAMAGFVTMLWVIPGVWVTVAAQFVWKKWRAER